MYALISRELGFFKGYEFRNNQMTPLWQKQPFEFNFTLAIFVDYKDAEIEAKKHADCKVLCVSVGE